MQQAKRSAELQLPPELFGGNVAGLFNHLGLAATHVTGNRWRVHAATTNAGRPTELLQVRTLAGPQRSAPQFDVLPKIVDPIPSPVQLTATLEKARRAAAAKAEGGDLLSTLYSSQIELALADPTRLAEFAQCHYKHLGVWTIADSAEFLFPDRGAHLVTADDSLLRRAKLPSVLFRMDQDPQVIAELRAGQVQEPAAGLLFSSSANLADTLILGGTFLGPLMGCLAPYQWAYHCPRLLSTLVFTFGCTLPSIKPYPVEPVNLLPTAAPRSAPAAPVFGPRASAEAIDWWVLRLNQLFAYLTDPATFADANGLYLPHQHQQWMLTIDQALRLTTSVQAAVRDKGAQLMLANTLLDTYADRVLGVDFVRLCTASYARKQIELVRAKMPSEAAQILLPIAERAVAALESLQHGFFIPHQRGETSLTLQLPDGSARQMSLESAAAKLLHIHRNATHGYGGKTGANRDKSVADERLLIQHDGRIPDDLALLPYLYLLVVLSHPERIRDSIIRNAEKST
ncbi:hypothetical protein [Nocardia amamiensis]|uniref:hypothetical protein n=1 Tax=Nocardia amamiensis TaxID=404578 RepID=UPI000837A6F5|nr:hypothetical protein [Nocardia amamiensis]